MGTLKARKSDIAIALAEVSIGSGLVDGSVLTKTGKLPKHVRSWIAGTLGLPIDCTDTELLESVVLNKQKLEIDGEMFALYLRGLREDRALSFTQIELSVYRMVSVRDLVHIQSTATPTEVPEIEATPTEVPAEVVNGDWRSWSESDYPLELQKEIRGIKRIMGSEYTPELESAIVADFWDEMNGN